MALDANHDGVISADEIANAPAVLKTLDKNGDGQLTFDIFNFDGFLGDIMTVNFNWKPYFEVERRKYRFRILNASMSRFIRLQLSDNSPMIQIGNDGNLLPAPVTLTQLDYQSTAERYDIVIDFSRYKNGDKVWLVNVAEHQNGAGPRGTVSLAAALAGKSADPGSARCQPGSTGPHSAARPQQDSDFQNAELRIRG